MEVKKIKQLADVLVKADLSELEIREGSDYLSLKRHRSGSAISGGATKNHQEQSLSSALVDFQQTQQPLATRGRNVGAPQHEAPQPELPEPLGFHNESRSDTALEKQADLNYIESPMVGTFYRSGEPGREPFVEVGSQVAAGDTVCIIEAMKMMNQINCEIHGRVAEVLVENGQPVEFGQRLFAVEVS